jgi:hypothetical protein
LAGLAVACGDSSGTGSGGAGTTTGSTTGATTSSTKAATVTSTGTGMAGDGNDTIDTATAMSAGQNGAFTSDPNGVSLDTPDMDVDFYKFDATQGPWTFFTQTNPNNTNGVFVDTVITIYNSAKQQIARNDDAFPRAGTDSTLSTILPSAGTYYVKVEEFCHSDLMTTGCDATYFSNITDTSYFLAAVPLTEDTTDHSERPEVEPNDTSAQSTLFGYKAIPMQPAGTYYLSEVWGDMPAATDQDWLTFTLPADVITDVPLSTTLKVPGRVNVGITIPPPSTAGNGSDLNMGVVDIVDATDNSVVARYDFTNEPVDGKRIDMTIPVQVSHQYFVHLTGGNYSAMGGAGKFYFFEQAAHSVNPIEGELLPTPVTNNDVASAESLTAAALNGGGNGFFVEGDLPAGDTDYFKVNVGAGTMASVFCGAQRSGSGLRNLTATLYDATGVTQLGTDTESATHDLAISNVAVTANQTVVFKVTATQDATVKSPSYRCVLVSQ